MDVFGPFLSGLAMLVDPWLLLLVAAGTIWGCVAGALPGLSASVAIAVVLPLTFVLGPIESVGILVGILIGTGYGNSIPAILVGVPGTPSAFLTAVEGFALHKAGKSGFALGSAYFATVSGQWLSILLFTIMVVPLSQLGYVFLSPEIFALHVLGLTAVVSLTGKNIVKGLIAVLFGLSISFIGRDPVNFVPRFDFGIPEFRVGIEPIVFVIGILAVSEIIRSLRQRYQWDSLSTEFSAKFPPVRSLGRLLPATGLGTLIGSFIGAIPGIGSTPAAAIAYQQARLVSRHPEEFGNGSPEGIAANEAAQSSSNAGELVPTLAFGIPGSAAMVLLLGAFSIHGLLPGPLLITRNPEMLHAAIAGLLIATITLAVVGWPLCRLLLRVALLDRSVVLILAAVLTLVGAYMLNRSIVDVFVMLAAALIGYFMIRYGFSTAAAALGMVLGVGLESNLRQGLLLMDGSFVQFLSRPITAGVLLLSLALLVYGAFSTWRLAKRDRRESQPAPSHVE